MILTRLLARLFHEPTPRDCARKRTHRVLFLDRIASGQWRRAL